jgi:hypothetical protein
VKLFELQELLTIEKFKSDCAPFLKDMKGAETLPYHGSFSDFSDYEIRTFKPRSGPRDTNPILHKEINAVLHDRFDHEDIRNWMFITGSTGVARQYGKRHAVFPIGSNYHYVWSPFVEDMSTHHTTHMDRANADEKVKHLPYDARREYANNTFLDDVATTPFKIDTDLKDGLDSFNEIHLKCERFYLFLCDGPTFENVINPFIRRTILSKHETD